METLALRFHALLASQALLCALCAISLLESKMTEYLRARRSLALAISGALAASALLAPAFTIATATGADAADDRVFTFVGDLQDELGCAADWAAECPETELAETGTAGVYAADFTLPAGSFNYKVAVNKSMDEAYGHGSENIPLALAGRAGSGSPLTTPRNESACSRLSCAETTVTPTMHWSRLPSAKPVRARISTL